MTGRFLRLHWTAWLGLAIGAILDVGTLTTARESLWAIWVAGVVTGATILLISLDFKTDSDRDPMPTFSTLECAYIQAHLFGSDQVRSRVEAHWAQTSGWNGHE